MSLGATISTFVPNTTISSSDVNSNFSNLNAATSITNGTGDAHQIIGHSLLGSVDSGIYNFTNPVSIGAKDLVALKLNNFWDGSNDRFISSSYTAYQLYANGSGLYARKSTNTPTANAVITWGASTAIFT